MPDTMRRGNTSGPTDADSKWGCCLMPKPTDVRVREAALYFLPIQTRVPFKFGTETMTQVTCARVRLRVEGADGRTAEGWGETPLSVQWSGPVCYRTRNGMKPSNP